MYISIAIRKPATPLSSRRALIANDVHFRHVGLELKVRQHLGHAMEMSHYSNRNSHKKTAVGGFNPSVMWDDYSQYMGK